MKRLIPILLLSLSCSAAFSQELILNQPDKLYAVFENSTVLENDPGKITIDSMVKHPDKYRFVSSKNFTQVTLPTKERWFRFKVCSALQTTICLYSDKPLPAPATLYVIKDKRIERKYLLGGEGEWLNPYYPVQVRKVWPLLLQPNKDYLIYWHSTTLAKSIVVSSTDRLFSLFQVDDTVGGFYFGFVLLIILYNLILFGRLKDWDHLIYAVWIGLNALVFGVLLGYFYEWIPMRYFGFFAKHILLINFLTASAHILFGMSFLQVRQLSKKLYGLGVGLISLMLFTGLTDSIFSFLPKELSGLLAFLSFLLDIIFTIVASTVAIKKGFKPAWYYLLGLFLILVGSLINIGMTMGQLSLNFLTQHSIQLGSILEMALFTLALSYKVDLLKQQREEAIVNQLKLSEENRQLIETQNRVLEEKVEQRTAELRASQAQLIQKEKLASLGELTAGIAHEIQNPLNFVNNFSEVSTELVDELNEEAQAGRTDDVLAIATDLRQNLQKITHHGYRASAIVKGMLEHSRASTGEKALTNLNALADEYLRLAYQGQRAKDKAFNGQLITDFDSRLSSVNVVAQDIGRVLLNLYNNAFYAIGQRARQAEAGYQPTVWVSSRQEPGRVLIGVKDNGTGISETIREKIFQPFFTTKPTGEGTGLGLSLSYDIVTKGHGGTMIVESRQGQGAEFVITLPC